MFAMRTSLLLGCLCGVLDVAAVITFINPPPNGPVSEYNEDPAWEFGSNQLIRWSFGTTPPNSSISLTLNQQTIDAGLFEYVFQNVAVESEYPWTVTTNKSLDLSRIFFFEIFITGQTTEAGISHYFNITGNPPDTASSSSATSTSTTASTKTSSPATPATAASTHTSASTTPSPGGGGLSLGAKVGIGVAVPVAVIAGLAAGWFFFGRRKKQDQSQQAPPPQYAQPHYGQPQYGQPPYGQPPATSPMSQSTGHMNSYYGPTMGNEPKEVDSRNLSPPLAELPHNRS